MLISVLIVFVVDCGFAIFLFQVIMTQDAGETGSSTLVDSFSVIISMMWRGETGFKRERSVCPWEGICWALIPRKFRGIVWKNFYYTFYSFFSAEQAFVTSHLSYYILTNAMWMGANSRDDEKGWSYSNGVPFNFVNWNNGKNLNV